jgi:hypothetical protein
MPTQSTYDDANLILRLYELRREEKLRQARQWFAASFRARSMEDLQRIAPPGSQENAYLRMVASYWEMAASFITSGVLNQELFFQSGGELLFVWERLRLIVPQFRQFNKNPHAWHNLEIVGTAFIKWMEANGPEAYSAFQQMAYTAGGDAPPAGQTPTGAPGA